jgi:hypothetical protein
MDSECGGGGGSVAGSVYATFVNMETFNDKKKQQPLSQGYSERSNKTRQELRLILCMIYLLLDEVIHVLHKY